MKENMPCTGHKEPSPDLTFNGAHRTTPNLPL
jgi:hypothetical protein